MFCCQKAPFPNHPLHLGPVVPGKKSISLVLPEQRTGDASTVNAGSLLGATQQERSHELLALHFVSCRQRAKYQRGDVPGLPAL